MLIKNQRHLTYIEAKRLLNITEMDNARGLCWMLDEAQENLRFLNSGRSAYHNMNDCFPEISLFQDCDSNEFKWPMNPDGIYHNSSDKELMRDIRNIVLDFAIEITK